MDFQKLFEALRTTPSGDNCQPWRFVRKQNGIGIVHDEIRAAHAFNVGHAASRLSLGCALELLNIAAAKQGFAIDFKVDGVGAHVTFKPAGSNPVGCLEDEIHKRATDRRNYRGGSFADPVFSDIRADGADFPTSQVAFCSEFSPPLLEYMGLCEKLVWSRENTMLDLLRWIRFSEAEAQTTLDGMRWRNLGVNYLDSRSLLFLRTFPQVGAFGVAKIIGSLAGQIVKRQLRSSAGIVLFAAPLDSLDNMVEVGRWALRMWLRLSRQGYGVQPLTVMSLFCFLENASLFPPNHFDSKFHLAFRTALPLLRESFSLTSNVVPAWAFRVGRSTPVPANMRTFRRPLI